MYPDLFYNSLNIGLPWIGIAIVYAIFDYSYNLLMCSMVGGVIQIREYYKDLKTRKIKIFKRGFLNKILENYKIGSHLLLQEFFADKLSWSWPITTLAIPTAIYGISRGLTTSGILSLTKNGINFHDYIMLPNNNQVQIFFWAFAVILGLRTFYRYQKERSGHTWFSKVWLFSFSRMFLFGFPLSYMILNIIYIWAQYSVSLFQIFSNDHIQYLIFHPDHMYGLGEVYKTVITMSVFLIVLSFLPSLMLIREKEQRYNKMYYFLIYSGIITLFLLLSLLIIKFDQRLGSIQSDALGKIQIQIDPSLRPNIGTLTNLAYFSLISTLPRGFPIPAWVSFLLSVRSLALFFEIVKIIFPSSYESNVVKLLQKILGV